MQIDFKQYGNILYVGQDGTSGYANAAKGYILEMLRQGVEVSWNPVTFEQNCEIDLTDQFEMTLRATINRPIMANTVFVHTTPDVWGQVRCQIREDVSKIIGCCCWENDRLPKGWADDINKNVDEVWVPSKHNFEVFQSSGVTIPINVHPYLLLNNKPQRVSDLKLCIGENEVINPDNYYIFYNISEYTPRKGIDELIHTYCKTFTKNDNVLLLLKLHHKHYTKESMGYCHHMVEEVKKLYPNGPLIKTYIERMNSIEISHLHSVGNCYVSLLKSEAFGLALLEADRYGNEIIVTGYGGHLDFLNETNAELVPYTMENVSEKMGEFSKIYTTDQKWAIPDLEKASKMMWDNYTYFNEYGYNLAEFSQFDRS